MPLLHKLEVITVTHLNMQIQSKNTSQSVTDIPTALEHGVIIQPNHQQPFITANLSTPSQLTLTYLWNVQIVVCHG